jgi:hypothetical protein
MTQLSLAGLTAISDIVRLEREVLELLEYRVMMDGEELEGLRKELEMGTTTPAL